MGITKTALFTAEQNELSSIAKVFAHPARIAIIQHLLQANQCCNSYLVEEIGLAQATISQHLRELKLAGLIKGSVEGVSMNYCIDPEKWSTISALFSDFFRSYKAPSCGPNC